MARKKQRKKKQSKAPVNAKSNNSTREEAATRFLPGAVAGFLLGGAMAAILDRRRGQPQNWAQPVLPEGSVANWLESYRTAEPEETIPDPSPREVAIMGGLYSSMQSFLLEDKTTCLVFVVHADIGTLEHAQRYAEHVAHEMEGERRWLTPESPEARNQQVELVFTTHNAGAGFTALQPFVLPWRDTSDTESVVEEAEDVLFDVD